TSFSSPTSGSLTHTFNFTNVNSQQGTISIREAGAENVSLAATSAGTVTIQNTNGSGTNTISIDGSANNAAFGGLMVMNPGSNNFGLQVQNFRPGAANPGIGKLLVMAGNGTNTINFNNSSATQATINSGTGANTIVVNNNNILGSAALGGLVVNV